MCFCVSGGHLSRARTYIHIHTHTHRFLGYLFYNKFSLSLCLAFNISSFTAAFRYAFTSVPLIWTSCLWSSERKLSLRVILLHTGRCCHPFLCSSCPGFLVDSLNIPSICFRFLCGVFVFKVTPCTYLTNSVLSSV